MNPWLVLSALLTLALLYVALPVAIGAFRQWRRPWRLTCPAAGSVAQIQVGAARASLAEVFGRQPQIDRCSLWPALAGCKQECLASHPHRGLDRVRSRSLARQLERATTIPLLVVSART